MAMFGFIACEQHECNDYDHSADIVGTWTCLTADYAEALVIKADGSAVSTGYDGTEYWENVAGNIVVKNSVVTMTFEDGDNFKGHIDVIPGMAFSIHNEEGESMTYNYCANDLSDEIVGMWVCHEGLPGVENDMAIKTYSEDGKYTLTTQASSFIDKDVVMAPGDYKIVGDLLFMSVAPQCLAARLTYTPNGTTLGDIMTETLYAPSENGDVYLTSSWLRVKQSLDLTGKTYDYSSAYITNAKGTDEDFSILGHTFNIAKIVAGDFDMMLRSVLFCLDTDANSIKQHFLVDGVEGNIETPITVVGNKVTIDYSDVNPALRKVEMYMFQDAKDSQLHMYMHSDAFINYFANLEVVTLLQAGKIDTTDAAAVEKVFADMEARVESINVSFVMKVRK